MSDTAFAGTIEGPMGVISDYVLTNSIIVLTSTLDSRVFKVLKVVGEIQFINNSYVIPVEQLYTNSGALPDPVQNDKFHVDFAIAGVQSDVKMIYDNVLTGTNANAAQKYFKFNRSWTTLSGNDNTLNISKTTLFGDVVSPIETIRNLSGVILRNTLIEIRKLTDDAIFATFRVNANSVISDVSTYYSITNLTLVSKDGNDQIKDELYYVKFVMAGVSGTNGTSGSAGSSGSSGSSGTSGTSGSSGTGFQTVEGGENANRVLLSTGNVNTAKISDSMRVSLTDPNAPSTPTRIRLEFTGSIRANAFTGSLDGFATSGSIVQVYGSSGTYTPPDWAKRITVIAVGAGGGGGGGCSNSSFNSAFWRTGGGGGAGGSVVVGSFEVSDMISGLSTTTQRTWTITVSDGGNGGSAGVGQSNGQPGVAGGWASFYNTNRPTATVAAPGGLGGAGGIQTSSGTYQPYVSGGAVRNVNSPNFYAGGPGGQGVATRNYGSSGTANDRLAVNPSGTGTIDTNWNAAALPFSGSLPHNGTLQLPSAIAPTGGGGGGGYARAGSTSTDTGTLGQWGGGGGAILQQNPLNPSANQPVVPGVIRPSTTSTSLTGIFNNWSQGNSGGTVGINTTNNQSIFWQNMRFGLGGVGGVPGFFAQVGAQPGGGGGGGAGGQGTGQNGARGGAGMVIVITEH
jgi:hypothetical protein